MADINEMAFACILSDACIGSRCVQVTFKDGGVDRSKLLAGELMELVDEGRIVVATGVYLALMGVHHSGRWLDFSERQFTMKLTDEFDTDQFIQAFAAFIEFMEEVD